jgi:hypothetical protein
MVSRCSSDHSPSTFTVAASPKGSRDLVDLFGALTIADKHALLLQRTTEEKFLRLQAAMSKKMAALSDQNDMLREKLLLLEKQESEGTVFLKKELEATLLQVRTLKEENESLKEENAKASQKTEERVAALYVDQIRELNEALQKSDDKVKDLERLHREDAFHVEAITQEKERTVQALTLQHTAEISVVRDEVQTLRAEIEKKRVLEEFKRIETADTDLIQECYTDVLKFLPSSYVYGIVGHYFLHADWVENLDAFIRKRRKTSPDVSNYIDQQTRDTKYLAELFGASMARLPQYAGQVKFAPIIDSYKTRLTELMRVRLERMKNP